MESLLASGFAIFVPAGVATVSASSVHDRIAGALEARNLSVVKSGRYLLACELPPGERPKGGSADLLLCDAPPGKLGSGRGFSFATEFGNWAQWHERAESEAQIYNLVHAANEAFAIESDFLGIKPVYLLETNEGLFIASRLADLFTLAGGGYRSLDREALFQQFLMGYALGARTLHRDVRRTRSGEAVEWTAGGGLKLSRPRRYAVANAIGSGIGIGLHQALQALEDALDRGLERYCSGTREPINIGLSGGFDSRVLAAELTKLGKELRAFTYGKWHHRDLRTARRIAKSLGIEHRLLDYPLDHYYETFPLFLSVMEGHGESKSTQIANLLRIEADHGAPLVHGFLGGSVSGDHLTGWFATAGLSSLDEVAERLAGLLARPATRLDLLQRILGFAVDLDAFRQEIREDLAETECPFQSAILWDLENRQRSMISTHLRMLGQKFDVIVPFYDRALLDCWLAMPRLGLDRRYLQRQFLARRFPELAKIPRDEEVAPITPNLKHQLLGLADSLARKAFLRPYSRISGYRMDSIWSLCQGLANAEQKERMATAIRDGRDLLTRTFDPGLELSDDILEEIRTAPERGDFQTGRMVFQMAGYARWLEGLSKDVRSEAANGGPQTAGQEAVA